MPYFEDELDAAHREDKKRYNKQMRDSERTLKTGKIVTEEQDEVMNRVELIESILEVSEALELKKVHKLIEEQGAELDIKILERLSRTPVMRSIEYLLENRTNKFDVAWKIFTEDGI